MPLQSSPLPLHVSLEHREALHSDFIFIGGGNIANAHQAKLVADSNVLDILISLGTVEGGGDVHLLEQLMFAGILAHAALSRGHVIPKLDDDLYESALGHIKTDIGSVEETVLGTLAKDKNLLGVITDDVVGTVCMPRQEVVSQVGAGAISHLVNQQYLGLPFIS